MKEHTKGAINDGNPESPERQIESSGDGYGIAVTASLIGMDRAMTNHPKTNEQIVRPSQHVPAPTPHLLM